MKPKFWNMISPCIDPEFESLPQVTGGVVCACNVSCGGLVIAAAVGWEEGGELWCWYILETSGVESVLLIDSWSTRGHLWMFSAVAGLFTPACSIDHKERSYWTIHMLVGNTIGKTMWLCWRGCMWAQNYLMEQQWPCGLLCFYIIVYAFQVQPLNCMIWRPKTHSLSAIVSKPDPPSAALGVIKITSTRKGLETFVQFSCVPGM